jgi:L,D-transpeptidase ErfK/SrfK
MLSILMFPGQGDAYQTQWQSGSDLVGAITSVVVVKGDTVHKIAQRHDVGYSALLAANPGIDAYHLKPGTVLLLPHRSILPTSKRSGIVINVATMQLFYFHPDSHRVDVYPIGVARIGWHTPTGTMKITQKKKNPVWIVPDSIREWRAQQGDPLPKIVPAGPDNPLGRYALRLSNPVYLIHGTNDPDGIGQRSTAGCIRLYPKDIKKVFETVPINTPVLIVDRPYVFGWDHDTLYFESHIPLLPKSLDQEEHMVWVALRQQLRHGWVVNVRESAITEAVVNAWRIPLPVGHRVKHAASPA